MEDYKHFSKQNNNCDRHDIGLRKQQLSSGMCLLDLKVNIRKKLRGIAGLGSLRCFLPKQMRHDSMSMALDYIAF